MDNAFLSLVEESLRQFPAGVFLTTGEQANPMTIGWGSIGIQWGRPVMTVMVRRSRYSHGLIENGDFTVSVPAPGTMKQELAFCGSKSGRDVDKIKELGLTMLDPKAGTVKAVGGCSIVFECKKIYTLPCPGNELMLDRDIVDRFYNGVTDEGGNLHDFYFGEIVAAYRE